MEEKLLKLYNESIKELSSIGINMLDKATIGEIDISISKRKTKRYGCCKQENPDFKYKTITKIGRRKIIKYEKYSKHHIEISKWLMELDNSIIKNTIIHEMIHCIPYCNNHGKEFTKYAKYINELLGYDIKRAGNKKEDYAKSNLKYEETEKYKYKIICTKCGQEIYRKRLNNKLIKYYRCGKCGGTLKLMSGTI